MKHLKKLSVVLMMTTLFSVSFTSCIDNEVSPVVEAIYEAQADLIAAQTAVQNAEASLLAAQAQAEQAQAAYLEAQAQVALANAASIDAGTANQLEQTAYNALVHEQQLLLLVAQTTTNVAAQENAAAIAQANFDIQMANLMAQLEAAGAQLATQYAYAYASAMNTANTILDDKLEAEAELAAANLFQTLDSDDNTVSTAYYLAQMAGNVTIAQANKVSIEAAIADMEAYIANPSTPEAMVSGLKATKADLEAQLATLAVTMQEQENIIAALLNQNDAQDELLTQYDSTLEDLEAAQADKEELDGWIEAANANIALWETQLANYPAALAAAELAAETAATAVEDAQTAVDNAMEALGEEVLPAAMAGDDALVAVTLYEELWNAQLAKADADLALSDLQTELLGLNVSYQDAIQELADQTAAYELGLPGVEALRDDAQTLLDDANTALDDAQADYDAKKAAFEADPTGFVWLGGTNGAVGLHADATTATDSYRNYDNTAGTMSALSLTDNGGTDETGNYTTYAAYAADAPTLGYDSFYNVGGDDVADGTKADRLETAADVLTDAIALVAAKEQALADAQEVVDNFGADLALAEAAYLHQKDIYENQVALVEAAELDVTNADTDVADAQEAVDNAVDALGTEILPAAEAGDDAIDNAETLYELLWNAELASLNADEVVADLEAADEASIQANIDDANDSIAIWNEALAVTVPLIAAYQAVLDSLQAEYDAYDANTGYSSTYYADLHAQLIAAWQVQWELDQQEAALNNEVELVDDLIAAYAADDLETLAGELAGLQDDLADATLAIEVAEQALASAQADANADVAYIAYLEAKIATLTARHANALAIAAKYKALMDAALAS
jgi:hypothetical protein